MESGICHLCISNFSNFLLMSFAENLGWKLTINERVRPAVRSILV